MSERAFVINVESDNERQDRSSTSKAGRTCGDTYTLTRGLLQDQETGSVLTVAPSGTEGRSTIRKSHPERPFDVISDAHSPIVKFTIAADERKRAKSKERALEEFREYSGRLREKTGNPFDFAAGILKDSFDPLLLDALLDEYFGADENDNLEIEE